MHTQLLATLSQQQVLTQEQQQSLRILQMPTQDLLGEIDLMLEVNPLLEADMQAATSAEERHDEEMRADEDRDFDDAQAESPVDQPYETWQGAPANDDEPFERIPSPESFRDELMADLGCMVLTHRRRELVACIIEELDDRGFFTTPLDALTALYDGILTEKDVSLDDWRDALKILQTMDPPGIGTSGPVDALKKQVARLTAKDASSHVLDVLHQIVERHLDKVAAGNQPALLKLAGGRAEVLDEALTLLKHLSPYPVARETDTLYIVPDIIVYTENSVSTARLNPASNIRVRLTSCDGLSPQSRRLHYAEAKAFIQRLEARRQTLQRLADAIVERQQRFFIDGPEALRPMTLSQIAEVLELSVPTISRAVSGKFIACRLGTIEMRSLFSAVSFESDGMPAQGAAEVQALIRSLIETENERHPLSDEKLSAELQKRGVAIARRTIAKYRTDAGIPSARARRKV